jgi:synaptosomal-associated protein 25
MNEAERNLTNLQKCCGICVLPWNRVNRKHRPLNSSTTTSTGKSSPTTTAEPKLRMTGDEAGGMPTTGYVTRITNDDRETEMDDNLQLVHSYLGNLKNIALDMNDTITNQNGQIERITHKTDVGNDRVTAANKQTQAILRKA